MMNRSQMTRSVVEGPAVANKKFQVQAMFPHKLFVKTFPTMDEAEAYCDLIKDKVREYSIFQKIYTMKNRTKK